MTRVERLWRGAEAVGSDLRHAGRTLRRAPAATLLAVACLGVGIGANGALFGVVDALLFRPPVGVRAPHELVRLELGQAGGALLTTRGPVLGATYPNYERLREQAGYLSAAAAYAARGVTLGGGAAARELNAILASGNYFDALGVRPALGRFFAPEEDATPGAGPVAVLSHAFWRAHFGGAASALGEELEINGARLTVIGVAPPGFVGVDLGAPDLWIPLTMAGTDAFGGARQLTPAVFWLRMVGRLAPGVTRAGAAAAPPLRLDAGPADAGTSVPGPATAGAALPVRVSALTTRFGAEHAGVSPIPVWVLGITAAVLLAACATVAGLLLARAAARGPEIATRLALGGSRARVVAQLLTESALLAALGTAAALVLAAWSTSLLALLPVPPLGRVVTGRVVLFTLALALPTTLLFGLAPALWAVRGDLAGLLRGGHAGTGAGPGRARRRGRPGLQASLVAAQVATTFVLLVAAGLFLRSLHHARALDLGFDLDRVLAASPGNLATRGFTGDDAARFYAAALDRLRAHPDVEAATIGSMIPYYLYGRSGFHVRDGRPDALQPRSVLTNSIEPDWFRTFGIRIVEGRGFEAHDRAGAPLVAVISAATAREYWPSASPLGACLASGPAETAACITIVGVAADARLTEIDGEPPAIVYMPADQAPRAGTGMSFFIRTRGNPAAAAGAMRAHIQALDARLPFIDTAPLAERARPQTLTWEVATQLFSTLAALAILLAAVGLHTVVSFVTLQRTRELGIRAALGASRARLLADVLARGATLAAAGAAAGAALSLVVSRLFAARLFGVSPLDPITYAAVAALLGAVTIAACAAPALRAARSAPAEALRHD